MQRPPTVYDVAERAGVSIATVSFTFRKPEKVRDATRDAVWAAARELGYVPSAAARSLARGSTETLGMYSFDLTLDPTEGSTAADATRVPQLIETTSDDDLRTYPLYVDEVQRGFERACRHLGRAVLLGAGPGSRASITDIAGRVDGLAVFPGQTPPTALEHISRQIPVVAFGLPPGTTGLHQILVDNRSGVRALVEHLVTVHGIRDMAFVGTVGVHDNAERFAGFQEALADHGIDVPTEPIDQTNIAEGERFAHLEALIAAKAVPRALICVSDQHAIEVLDLLAAHHIPVPERVAVTGFDGVAAGRLTRPALTTMRQPMDVMGRLAVEVLMRHTLERSGATESHVLPVQPVIRQSCGCSTPDAARISSVRTV